MGWKRTIKYYWKRVIRLHDNPSKISRGIAAGVSISFTPLPGSHFPQAIFWAYIFRGNILAALVASWVGNPWTFPLMWWTSYALGKFIFDSFGMATLEIPDHFTWSDLWTAVKAHPWELVLPWVLGGYMMMFITWPIVFYLARPIVAAAQHKRQIAKVKRRHARHGHGHPGHGR